MSEIDENVSLVVIMKSVVTAMSIPGVTPMNYEPGRSIQIIESIGELDNSITLKGEKYPLFAMLLPIKVKRGESVSSYGITTIPRIIIATNTKIWDGTEHVMPRFEDDGTFPTILYKCYYEFLKQLSYSPYIIGSDPDAFEHEMMENPGIQESPGSTDFIDSIEIYNLELNLNQIKTCN